MALTLSTPSPGGYQRYKNDTAAFLTWLLRAATTCGYQLGDSKNSSKAQEGSRVTLSVGDKKILVKDIVDQAKVVCSKVVRSCLLPRGIARLAERAIAARKKHSEHFEHRGERASNDGHKHFTTTLQVALGMLQQHATKHYQKPEPKSAETETSSKLNNLFEHLDLEDCEDGDDSLDDYARRVLNPTTPDAKQKTGKNTIHPTATVDSVDIVMSIMCFFDDLHVLRFQLTELWLSKSVGPIPFAMAFNAALAFAEQMETDLLRDLFPDDASWDKLNFDFCGVKSAYSMITGLSDAADYGDYRACGMGPDVIFDPVNHFWFCDIAMSLSKLSAALLRRKKEKNTMEDYKKRRDRLGPEKAGCMVWPRVESMDMLFLTSCHNADAIMTTRAFKEAKKKDEVWTAFLIDTFLRAEQLPMLGHHIQREKHTNMFTKAVLQLADGKVGATAILGTLFIQDLNNLTVFGKKADWYQPLRTLAEETYGKIKHFKTDYKVLDLEGPRLRKPDTAHLTDIGQLWYMIKDHEGEWFTYQQCAGVKQSGHNWRLREGGEYLLDAFQRAGFEPDMSILKPRVMSIYQLEYQFMLPTEDANRMWTRNPLACGTMMLNVKLAYQEAGICLANTQLSILAVAYLYTALKSSNLLRGEWKAMEAVVEANMGSLFFGALPADPSKRHGCWSLRIGNHPFLSNKNENKMAMGGLGRDRAGKILPTSKAGPDCLALSDASHLLCEWIRDKESMIRTVYAVHDIMAKKGLSPAKTAKEKSNLNPFSFLHDFATFIEEDIKRLDIDYMALTRDCTNILQALLDNKVIEVSPQSRGLPSKLSKSLAWTSHYMCETLDNQPSSLLFAMECLLFQDMCWYECKQRKKTVLAIQKKYPAFDVTELSPMEKAGEFAQKYLERRDMLSPVDEKKDGHGTKENVDSTSGGLDWEPLMRALAEGRVDDMVEAVKNVAGVQDSVKDSTNSRLSGNANMGKDFAKNLKGKWPTF